MRESPSRGIHDASRILTQGGLVDLDDPDAGFLEVKDLVPNRQGQLLGLLLMGDVLTGPRPVENGDRAGEHALHRLGGARLGIGAPCHGDRLGTAHIAPDDRRLDAAGAVGLHPGVLREQETVEVLTEVFDHVVALKLPMHQHVESDLLLLGHHIVDLTSNEFVVLPLGDLTLAKAGAFGTHLLGLRERAYRRSGQQRQAKRLTLEPLAFATLGSAHIVRIGKGGDAGAHNFVGDWLAASAVD